MNLLASSFGDGDVLLWMFELFVFIIWFWLLVVVFGDLFRDHETSGGVKAIWVIVLILLPYLGILIYLIFRGHGMAGRAAAAQKAAQDQFSAQVRSATGSGSAADQIAQAKALLDQGAINQSEFDSLKAKALGA